MYGFIKRNATHFSNPHTKLSLLSFFVLSQLEYAAFVWNPTGVVYIRRVERVQQLFFRFALQNLSLAKQY